MASSDWWVRVRIDLAEQPEVVAVSAALAADPDLIVGKLVRLWGWAKRVTRDGHIPRVTYAYLDSYLGLPNICLALERVGWLARDSGALVIPGFEKYLSQTADTRTDAADRKRRQRERERRDNVTESCDNTVTRLEKRREEKKEEEPPTPKGGRAGADPDGFEEFWKAYPRHTARQKALEVWQRLAPDEALRQLIHAAIRRQQGTEQWRRGVYPHAATWLRGRRWEDEVRDPEDLFRAAVDRAFEGTEARNGRGMEGVGELPRPDVRPAEPG